MNNQARDEVRAMIRAFRIGPHNIGEIAEKFATLHAYALVFEQILTALAGVDEDERARVLALAADGAGVDHEELRRELEYR